MNARRVPSLGLVLASARVNMVWLDFQVSGGLGKTQKQQVQWCFRCHVAALQRRNRPSGPGQVDQRWSRSRSQSGSEVGGWGSGTATSGKKQERK